MIIFYIERIANSRSCPKCGLSCYKVKYGDKDNTNEVTKHNPHSKTVWYLPIIPRFKCMFANPTNAKNHRWHVDERKCDELLCDLADYM